MNLDSATEALVPPETEWLAVPIFEDDAAPPPSTRETPIGSLLARLLEAKNLLGGLGDQTPILGATDLGVAAVQAFGLGKRDKFRPGMAFSAGVALAKRLATKPRGKVAVLLPDAGDPFAVASALTEGLVVGMSGPDLKKKERGRHPFESLVIVAPGSDPEVLRKSVRRGEVVGNAVNLARELANTPPAEKSPASLADRVRSLARGRGNQGRPSGTRAKSARSGSAGSWASRAGRSIPPGSWSSSGRMGATGRRSPSSARG